MPSATPVVRFRSVTKRYGDGPQVLRDIDLAVEEGEFVSFIGPSGCGKSTLLRLIAGLSPVTSGTLELNTNGSPKRSDEVAFVFQEPTLLPWLDVARNVEVPLRLRGMPSAEIRLRCHQALRRVRLEDRAHAYPRQLSGGQKMRVSIARALAVRPRLLLLDEPFGALDEMTRDHLNEELLTIRQEFAWTAFFVTHSVAEAVFLSNRIVVLAPNPGRIHAELSVPFAYPRTAETRLEPEYQQLIVEVSRQLRSAEHAKEVRA